MVVVVDIVRTVCLVHHTKSDSGPESSWGCSGGRYNGSLIVFLSPSTLWSYPGGAIKRHTSPFKPTLQDTNMIVVLITSRLALTPSHSRGALVVVVITAATIPVPGSPTYW